MRKRRFIDAPTAVRCLATVRLRDGSTAQCGRRGVKLRDGLCVQHWRIAQRSTALHVIDLMLLLQESLAAGKRE